MTKQPKTLKAREFLFYTEDQALAEVEDLIPRPNRRVMWTILQLYYDDPTVHFEVQPQGQRNQVELGLHFEADVDRNEARAQYVAARAPELMATLGPEWELEEWTASWRRLHRVFRYERLTAELGREVAGQFALLLRTLQPMIPELEAIPNNTPASSVGRRGQAASV